jgi:hypothetical protein
MYLCKDIILCVCRNTIFSLLHCLFTLQLIHLAATLLHPRYRLLKKCSLYEVRECHLYIRNRMAEIKAMEQKNPNLMFHNIVQWFTM